MHAPEHKLFPSEVAHRPRPFLNRDAEYDWLIALEFGEVDDGQFSESWRRMGESFGYLSLEPGGEEVGFKVVEFSEFDTHDPEYAEIWEGPRFDAPALGLRNATAGEVCVAAAVFFGNDSSLNRFYFDHAVAATGEEAAHYWKCCLQAGDCMAHFGLGYTLVELGRLREAYRHLRAYTEIVPANAWAWCWLGRCCEEMGEHPEALAGYRRAIELEQEGGDATDAPELLEALEAGTPRSAASREELDGDDELGEAPY